MKRALMAVLLACGAVFAVAGCGETEGSSGAAEDVEPAPAVAAGPKVRGTIGYSFFYSGDSEARRLVRGSDAWCRWNDGAVEMHVRFVNRMAADVTIDLQPNYRIRAGGLHGDGIGSRKDVSVPAGSAREWTDSVGQPEGVAPDSPISECAPEINGVDLG